MGRRSIRYRHPNVDAALLQAQVGKEMALTLLTGQTLQGTLVSVDTNTLVLRDNSQMLAQASHRHTIQVAAIRELELTPGTRY